MLSSAQARPALPEVKSPAQSRKSKCVEVRALMLSPSIFRVVSMQLQASMSRSFMLATGEVLSGLPLLVDRTWVKQRVPHISASAHKGTRKRLAIVGGGKGMAG